MQITNSHTMKSYSPRSESVAKTVVQPKSSEAVEVTDSVASSVPGPSLSSPKLDRAQPIAQESEAAEASSIERIEKLLISSLTDSKAEAALLGLLQNLNSSGRLKPVMGSLINAAVMVGALPSMSEERREEMVGLAVGMVDAQFRERGLTPDTAGVEYKDWDQLSAEHLAAVRNTQAPPRMAGATSSFLNPQFVSELETLQGAEFRGGNSVKTLMDGPASFAERDRLIDGAKDSIHLMSWAFYDDKTGWDTANKLVEKAEQGVDVKIMVDGQVSKRSAHDAPISFLEKNGVEVVRWHDPDRPYDGQHRKMMIVDGKEAVTGGINIGDVYSHRYGDVKWRDTDALITGPAVSDGARLFAELWNQQVEGTGRPTVDSVPPPEAASGGVRSAVVDHKPGPDGDAHIMLSVMKAIEGATESVDIENAYFINTPGMKDVLLNALADGVKVRLLTNSAESIDEPLISMPILSSLPELIEAGAEVYLKKGDTLHSKFMVCDGIFSSVGSHNHHPRSQRFEGEMVVNSLDANLASEFSNAFEADIAAATRIETVEDLEIPKSPLGLLATRYFFDAL